MTDEDAVEAKLRGYNCLIKFKDGEELFLEIPSLVDDDHACNWFADVDRFLNSPPTGDFTPIADISIVKDTVKYIRKI